MLHALTDQNVVYADTRCVLRQTHHTKWLFEGKSKRQQAIELVHSNRTRNPAPARDSFLLSVTHQSLLFRPAAQSPNDAHTDPPPAPAANHTHSLPALPLSLPPSPL